MLAESQGSSGEEVSSGRYQMCSFDTLPNRAINMLNVFPRAILHSVVIHLRKLNSSLERSVARHLN